MDAPLMLRTSAWLFVLPAWLIVVHARIAVADFVLLLVAAFR
jgi:hypothetical protein